MKISVIVCTYNRAKYLPKTLQCLADQSAPPNLYEVLIVDNNSRDDTAKIADNFTSTYPNFKYFLEENQGHTYARNKGIQEAANDIFSFIDDDAFVRQDFVANTIRYFEANPQIAAIGGKIIPVYETGEPEWMSVYLWPLVAALDMGETPKPFPGAKYPIGANMAYRREIFDKYGTFDVTLGRRGSELEGGDEKEMFIRMKKSKEVIHYVPSVVVDHIIPEKRIQMEYIKGLAIGVGTSERRRLGKENLQSKLSKVLDEIIKIGGTFAISAYYLIIGKPSAAVMLVKFRYWVVKGYFLV